MYDVIIIGGGIVGLATAFRLKEANPNLKIAIVEKESSVARHQTGNNSGVIHSGIYYKPGSLKATNCREGYHQLLDFCKKEGIPFELCGKIITATREDELERLENLYQRGLQNGLEKISKISKEQIREYEPHATGIAGIHVPYTGIVDYKVISSKLAEIFINRQGGELYLSSKVISIKQKSTSCEIVTASKTFESRLVVNTAGLYSDQIARLSGITTDVRIIPFRGEYYEVVEAKHHLVKNLIYPVPDPAFPFLGVHFTRRIDGGIEAGPNAVFAFKREGYKKTDFSFKESIESLAWPGFIKVMWKYWNIGLVEYYRSYNKTAFTKALQRLMPAIQKDDLKPGGSGVRAQACTRDGSLIDDFIIRETTLMIHVLNAPSPAATSCLSIGGKIAGLVLNR
jgi:(S)-2-hydroxyglutarate dehydrogenase